MVAEPASMEAVVAATAAVVASAQLAVEDIAAVVAVGIASRTKVL